MRDDSTDVGGQHIIPIPFVSDSPGGMLVYLMELIFRLM